MSGRSGRPNRKEEEGASRYPRAAGRRAGIGQLFCGLAGWTGKPCCRAAAAAVEAAVLSKGAGDSPMLADSSASEVAQEA